MNITQEQIKQLKENEKPFCKMTAEMQSEFRTIISHDGVEFGQFLDENGDWRAIVNNDFALNRAYRLNPGYQPKPSIVECEIKQEVDSKAGRLGITMPNRQRILLSEVTNEPDFIGFKFEDGTWYELPIKPVDADGNIVTGEVPIARIMSGEIKVLHATHCLFKEVAR